MRVDITPLPDNVDLDEVEALAATLPGEFLVRLPPGSGSLPEILLNVENENDYPRWNIIPPSDLNKITGIGYILELTNLCLMLVLRLHQRQLPEESSPNIEAVSETVYVAYAVFENNAWYPAVPEADLVVQAFQTLQTLKALGI